MSISKTATVDSRLITNYPHTTKFIENKIKNSAQKILKLKNTGEHQEILKKIEIIKESIITSILEKVSDDNFTVTLDSEICEKIKEKTNEEFENNPDILKICQDNAQRIQKNLLKYEEIRKDTQEFLATCIEIEKIAQKEFPELTFTKFIHMLFCSFFGLTKEQQNNNGLHYQNIQLIHQIEKNLNNITKNILQVKHSINIKFIAIIIFTLENFHNINFKKNIELTFEDQIIKLQNILKKSNRNNYKIIQAYIHNFNRLRTETPQEKLFRKLFNKKITDFYKMDPSTFIE